MEPEKISHKLMLVKSVDEHGKIPKSIIFLTLSSALGGFLFGYCTGVTSGAMLFIIKHFALSTIWHQLIVSITIAAAWVASLIAGNSADRYGRKNVIIASSCLYGIGSLMMGLSPTKEVLLLGRAVVGVAVGLSSMCIPLYLSEIAPISIRGRLTLTYIIFICGGQFISLLVCGAFSTVLYGWRFMMGASMIPALIHFISFIRAPESPRWLVQHKRIDEAMDVLIKYRPTDTNVKRELNSMMGVSTNEERSFLDIIKTPTVFRPLILGCTLQLAQQLTGINTVVFYSSSIISMAGIRDETLSITFATLGAFCNFIFTFVGMWLVDRIGRRLLTLYSLGGVCLSLFVLALSFNIAHVNDPKISSISLDNSGCSSYTTCSNCIQNPSCGFCFDSTRMDNSSCLLVDQTQQNKKSKFGLCSYQEIPATFAYDWCPNWYAWMSILGLCLYLCSFAPGMGPMPWVINSEIYPDWAIARCISITTSVNWAANVLLSLSFLSLVETFTKFGVFYFYMVVGLLSWIFFYFALPETKGMSLEDMEKVFESPLCSNKIKRRS